MNSSGYDLYIDDPVTVTVKSKSSQSAYEDFNDADWLDLQSEERYKREYEQSIPSRLK